jgi:hypothetical protein
MSPREERSIWIVQLLVMEVLSGLGPAAMVVVHPGDEIPYGTVVEAVPLPR